MKERRYTIVGYFAGFYLLFFFYFAMFCKSCWNLKYYSPHLPGFVLGLTATYLVFLVFHEDELKVEKYKKK